MLIKRVMGGRIVASPAEVASVTNSNLPEHVEHTAVQHSRPNPSVEPKSMPTDLVGDEGQPNAGVAATTKKTKKASRKRKSKKSTKKTVKKSSGVGKKQGEAKEVEEAKESASLPKEVGGYAVVPHRPSPPPEGELPEGVETEDVEEAPVTSERMVPEIPQTHTTVHEEEVNVEEKVGELKSGKGPKQFMTRASEASQAVKELLKEAGEKASKGESLKEALAEAGKEHVKELRQEKLKQVEEGKENESMPSAMPKKPAELGIVSGSKKTQIVSKPAESRSHTTGKKIGVTHFVALVNNKVKKRIAKEIKDYIRKLPPYIRAKIRASDYISALDMAKTANDVKKVIEMLNSTVKHLYLQHAKKEVLKNIASLPVTLKEVLVAQHVYGDIKNKVRNAKSVEELNEAIKEINDEIRDAVARVNVHLGRWYDNWFNGIMAKLQEYKSIQLFNEAKKDVLKQLESLPESVKEQMGGKLEEIEKKVKGAKNAEELNEAIKEANEAVKEAQENAQVAEFRYLRWMGSHLGTESKLKEYSSFEDAVNAVKKEIESLPEEVKQYIGAEDFVKKLDNAKTYKDIVNIVNEVNEKLRKYNIAKGRQVAFLNKIIRQSYREELVRYVSPRSVVRDYYKKLVDYLTQVDPDAMIQFTQEFKGKFRGRMTAERAKKLMEQMRQEAEKLALHAYKKKILSDLGDYEKKINASFYYPVYKVVKEYEEKVRNVKSLDELRKVVNQMNLKLKETAIINNIGLEGIKLPSIKDIAEGRWPGLVSQSVFGGITANEDLTPAQKALWLSNMGNEDLSSQIMGFWMNRPHMTALTQSPEKEVDLAIKDWEKTHPTTLSEMIMQEAMKDKGLSAGAGAFLAGVIGSLEAPLLPETYISMYKLATSPKYREEVKESFTKLMSERPELFWGNIIGQAVGVGLMAGLGKAVGSLEEPVLKVQEFKPIYTTIEGKFSPTEEVGSIKLKQWGFWRTKAKIPEAFEIEKATIKNIGLKGGTITKLIKEPTGIKEIKVIPVEGEVIRPSLARLISVGEGGEEELPSFARIFAEKGVASEKVAMTKLGEPLGKEVKFLDVTSFEEGGKPIVSVKGGEVASIKGLKSKLIGGKLAKLMELEYSPTEDITMMLKGEASRYPLKLGKVEIELLGRKGIPKEVLEEVKGSKPSTFERIRNVLAETKRSVTEKVEGAVKGETEIPVQFEESPEESVSLYEWLYGGKEGEEVEPAKGVTAGERYGGEGVTKEAVGGKGGQKLQLLLKQRGKEAVKNMAKEMKMYRIVEEGGGMKPSAVMITLAPLADIGELPSQLFKSNQLLRTMTPESMRFTLPEMEVGKSLKEISGITVSQLPEFMVRKELGAGMGAGMMGGLRLGQPQFGRLRLFLPTMIAEGYGQRLMPLPVVYEGEVPKAMSMMMGVPMESGEMMMREGAFATPRTRYEVTESPSAFTPTLTSPRPQPIIKTKEEENPTEITSPSENPELGGVPSEEFSVAPTEEEVQAPKLTPYQIPKLKTPPVPVPPSTESSRTWRPRFWFAYGFPMYWGYRRRLPNRYMREVLII